MSFEWTSQPQSIQSIANQYNLPVAIRSAPGFRGSDRPIILHSILRVTFAFGRALRATQLTTNGPVSYIPVDSEIVAVPLNYPGYFECLSSKDHENQTDRISPEFNLSAIVERMQLDHRPQAFYVAAPLRVYTLETDHEGITRRTWHSIEPHQVILFSKLVHIKYTPTANDELTDDDYQLSWWFCFGKQIIDRYEYALQCILAQQICFISCSSTEGVNLIPVGQQGSTNVNKLQTIQNLTQYFPNQIKITLARLPGSYAYSDFNGDLQLLGTRFEEFVVCASLTSLNVVAIPKNTPVKFVVSSISSSSSSSSPSPQIRQALSRCQIFVQSFNMQIRRIIISSFRSVVSHRSRSRYPKIQSAIENQFKKYKRSYSANPKISIDDDQATTASTTDEGYRSNSRTANRRNNARKHRAHSVNMGDVSNHHSLRRTVSTEDKTHYESFIQSAKVNKSLSTLAPALPKKPPNFPYPSLANTNATGNSLIEDIDAPKADGSILIDESNELFLALPSDS